VAGIKRVSLIYFMSRRINRQECLRPELFKGWLALLAARLNIVENMI
jgi:hypothetical protein